MSIIKSLKLEIQNIQKQIESIQSLCSHPDSCVSKTPKSGSRDGYSIDYYWYDCECHLCDKTWREDQ